MLSSSSITHGWKYNSLGPCGRQMLLGILYECRANHVEILPSFVTNGTPQHSGNVRGARDILQESHVNGACFKVHTGNGEQVNTRSVVSPTSPRLLIKVGLVWCHCSHEMAVACSGVHIK